MTVAIAGFILSLLLALAYGAAFHLLVGGNLPSVLIYIVASAIGFVLGHFVGLFLGIDTLQLGAVHLLTASIGSWLLLIFTRWFLNPPPDES